MRFIMEDIPEETDELALYNSQVKGSKDKKASIPLPSPTSATLEEGAAQSPPPSQPTEEINPRQSTASSGSINSALSAEEQQSSGAPSTSGSTGEKAHVPIIMGNTGSSSYVYEIPHCEPAVKKENSRMDKVRNSIRNALNRKPSKDYFDKNKKKKEDQANNNNGVVKPAGDDIDGSYYTDNITRSATLPNNYGRQIPNGNTPINDTLKNATLQARLLPAYKTPEQGYIGNIENRRRIMSTPAYSRNRTHSQSSNYSQRYHSTNRVVSTHIPAHIDKRLVRSRSVGVIPDAELKMRKTASASVVKIDDCEDWIV